jgi:uncharacterized protein YaiE (UPF0345 family)
LCISHTVQFEDGTKKTLGVILPTEQALTFETHVPERMEIISGECRVKIAVYHNCVLMDWKANIRKF